MKKALFYFLLLPFCLTALENSVFPYHFELNPKKYSNSQMEEIASAQERPSIRIATYNMLFDYYDAALDPINRWPQRLPRIVELVTHVNADVIGIQELTPHQMKSLLEKLPDYDFFADFTRSEPDGILIKKDRFIWMEGQIWDLEGKPFTMVRLKDKITGSEFAAFNIHLSFSGIEKRELQVKKILEIAQTFQCPILIMGDMNTFPNRPDLEKLPFLDGDHINRLFTSTILEDSFNKAVLGHIGPLSTFTNNGIDIVPFQGVGTPGVILDHIFVSDQVTVLLHATEKATVDQCYPSDHLPVVVDIVLK